MKASSFTEVTDRRDYVYAFLGFWGSYAEFLKPNYGLSVNDVFIQSAWALAAASNSLDILGFCSALEPLDGLPSWVPTWGSLPNALAFAGKYNTEVFCASGSYIHQHSGAKDVHQLSIRGRKVGSVEHIVYQFPGPLSENFSKDPQSLREFLNLDGCMEVLKTCGVDSQDTDELRERLLTVILAGAKIPVGHDGKDWKITVKPPDLHIADLLRAHDSAEIVSKFRMVCSKVHSF